MKVRCPKCGTVSNIDPEKIPDDGMHARCPKCNNRMFIRKPGKPQPAAEKKPTPPAADKGGETRRASAPLRKAGQARTAEEEVEGELPIVKPDSASPLGCLIALGVVIVISFIVMIVGVYSGPDEAAVAPAPQPKTIAGEKPDNYFHKDLMVLRNTLLQFKGRGYTAAGARPECRLIFNLMDKCGSGCGKIVRANIDPLGNSKGFTAEVFCADQKHMVTFFWTDYTLQVDGKSCD